MLSLKTIVTQTYPAAILRVYRSLQVGQPPNQEDAKRAVAWDWSILSNPPLAQADLAQADIEGSEAPAMSVATRLAIVHDWIEETQGRLRLRASYDAGRPYDPVSILILAENCEWVRRTNVSGLPDVQQGKMHPICLELGVGNCKAAYRHDRSSIA